jgi:hypothetical protein
MEIKCRYYVDFVAIFAAAVVVVIVPVVDDVFVFDDPGFVRYFVSVSKQFRHFERS